MNRPPRNLRSRPRGAAGNAPAPDEASLRPSWPLVALVLAVAALLRFAFLDSMEFWWDEFVTIGRSLPSIPDLLRGLFHQSPNVATDCSPPLHHLLVHAALSLGRETWLLKTPAVLAGLASLVFVQLIGERLFGRRVGFLAALFCALALFHIYYSRDIRWYSTFYACSLGGLYFLLRATAGNAWRHWGLFALCTALSLYASYMAATFIAGQMLFIAGTAWSLARHGEKERARGMAWRAFVALAAAAVLYSPWIPGQYIAFLSFKGKGVRVPFEPEFYLSTFRFYLEYFYQGDFNRLWIAGPLCVLGLVAGLARRERRRGVLALCCWALVPVAGVHAVKTEFGVSPKYVMGLFYFMAFALALGLDAVARPLERPGRPRAVLAGWAVSLALLAAAGWSNFNYPSFYQGVMNSDKALFRDVALAARPGEHLFFETPRSLSFLGHWYLGEAFPTARGRLDRSYKRALLVSSGGLGLPGHAPVVRREGLHAARFALVNESPLAVLPGPDQAWTYREDFRDLRLHAQAWSTDNAAVDLAYGGLLPADSTRPGEAVYAFAAPHGLTVEDLAVTLGATVTRRNLTECDGFVELLAGSDPAALSPVGRLGLGDAPEQARGPDYRGAYVTDKTFALPAEALRGERIFLALRFSIGTVDGSFAVSSLAVRARCAGQPPTPAEAARLAGLATLANLPLERAPREPGAARPGRLVAFSLDETLFPADTDSGCAPSAQRGDFLAAHPGLSPVFTARLPDGRPYLEVYDPWLDQGVSLEPEQALVLDTDSPPRGLLAPGSLAPVFLESAAGVIPLSQGLPPSSATRINPGAGVGVVARPLFDAQGFDPRDLDAQRDIRVSTDEASLGCLPGKPCFAAYRFKSFYPVSRVVVSSYPRMFHDRARVNFVRMSLCADGGPWREVFTLRSSGRGAWAGPDTHRVDEILLDAPAKDLVLRLEMASDACQWRSSPERPMTVELYSRAAPPPLPGGAPLRLANASPGATRARFLACAQPLSTWERLRPGLVITPFWRFLF